jgi:CsoR family transcriptional regulator, copper-sensing transcriptional repressor
MADLTTVRESAASGAAAAPDASVHPSPAAAPGPDTTGARPDHGPHGVNEAALLRMKSIEGQVRGIARMIESERYCMDIVDQISAVRAALAKVSENILQRHIETCVVVDLRHGSTEDQERVIAELMDAFSRRVR